jgi:hypothetical protein
MNPGAESGAYWKVEKLSAFPSAAASSSVAFVCPADLLAPVQTGLRKGKKVQAPKRHDNL